MTTYEDFFARQQAREPYVNRELEAYAYGVAMGLNAGGYTCDQCGASRWSKPTSAGWIECGLECGNYIDAKFFIDDRGYARDLSIDNRSRYA